MGRHRQRAVINAAVHDYLVEFGYDCAAAALQEEVHWRVAGECQVCQWLCCLYHVSWYQPLSTVR